jgi:hypothetical protein
MTSLLDNLPSVIARPELKQDDVQSVNGGDGKPHIIIHSRELTGEEKDLFRSYGTVLEWSPSFANIPLAKLRFDYLLLNIHQKEARVLLMVNPTDDYHLVGVCRSWEALDDWAGQVHVENLLRTLPARSPFKANFDALLCSEKINAPSCAKALIRLVLDVMGGISKK